MELFNMFKNELINQQAEQAPIENSQIPNLPNAPIREIANATGENQGLVGKILGMGLPLIMGQLNENTNDPQGSSSLFNALTQHENVDYSNPNNIDPEDGNKILGHIFGNKENRVTSEIGNQVGVNPDQVKKVLMYLAPLALAYLANKKKNQAFNEKSISDYTRDEANQFDNQLGGGLGGILGNILGGGNNNQPQQKSGGLMDILGGLFGK